MRRTYEMGHCTIHNVKTQKRLKFLQKILSFAQIDRVKMVVGELLPCGEVPEARGQPVPPEEDGRGGRQVDRQ